MSFKELYALMELDRKRSPWSAQNTFEQRFAKLQNEVDEIKEALAKQDYENLKDEIGDALFDIMFLIVMAKEKGLFSKEDVVANSIAKINRRKPWLHTDEKITIEEEKRRWQEAKRKERA